jgi:hypothetical protein
LAAGNGPAVAIDEPDREIAVGLPGQESAVTFGIHNRAGRPVRVIGLARC